MAAAIAAPIEKTNSRRVTESRRAECMRIQGIAGFAALLGAAWVHAGDLEQCQLLANHGEATACLEQAAIAKQAQLATAEDKFRGVLKQWDEKGSYRDTAIRTFNIAVLGFEKHQKEICNFEVAAASGKNSAADLGARCRYRTANERVQLLEDQLKLFTP